MIEAQCRRILVHRIKAPSWIITGLIKAGRRRRDPVEPRKRELFNQPAKRYIS
jgi:hypothetical protein